MSESATVIYHDEKPIADAGGSLNVSPVQALEFMMAQMPPADFPVKHTFTPGLCLREIFMPAGSFLTSMQHKTEHPFIVVSGVIEVLDHAGPFMIEAPYMGITKAGTKRVLYAHEDTTWITIHANPENLQTPDEMAERILEPMDNPLLGKDHPRLDGWREPKKETIS